LVGDSVGLGCARGRACGLAPSLSGRLFCTASGEGKSGKDAEKDAGKDAGEGKKKGKKVDSRKQKGMFYTSVDSCSELNAEMNGLVHRFSEQQMKTLFPSGLMGDIQAESKQSGINALMIRNDMTEIIDTMKTVENSDTPLDLGLELLVGERGIGKSSTLNGVVAYARASGWLTMVIPDCVEWVTETGALLRGTGTAAPVINSKFHPGFFTQPLGAKMILEEMKLLHEDKLKTLPQRIQHANKYYSDQDTSLMGIVERGLTKARDSGDAVYDLRRELALVEEFPVLLAVDQLNAVYWPTCFYSKGKNIAPEKLLFCEALRFLDSEGNLRENQTMKNGLVLGATTGKYRLPRSPKVIDQCIEDNNNEVVFFRPFHDFGEKLQPRALKTFRRFGRKNPSKDVRANAELDERNKAYSDPNIKVREVSPYTLTEVKNILKFYRSLKLFEQNVISDQAWLAKTAITTGYVPREVREMIMPFL